MLRRVGAAPGENRANRIKVILPALPRRFGSGSSTSLMRMPKPETLLSQISLRVRFGAGGKDLSRRSVIRRRLP